MHNDFSNKYKIILAFLASTAAACALVQKPSSSATKPCTAKNAADPMCNKQQLSPTPAAKNIRKNPDNSKKKQPQAPTSPKERKPDEDELPNRKEDQF